MKGSDYIGNSGYTVKWILEKLCQSDDDIGEACKNRLIKNVEVERLPEGKGYQSFIYLIRIEYVRNEVIKNFKLIMKIPTMKYVEEGARNMKMVGEALQHFLEFSKSLHDKECLTYELLKSLHSAGFPIPKSYHIERRPVVETPENNRLCPGALFLEYVDGISIGLASSLTKIQLLNAAKDMAVLHDHVDQLDKTLWKGKLATHKFDARGVETMQKCLEYAAEDIPGARPFAERLKSLDLHNLAVFSMKLLPKRLNAVTLCHGDLWTSNLIIEKGKDGSSGDRIAAYVDWQMAFEGNQMQDLCELICVCSDAEVRTDCWLEVVTSYYNHLCLLYAKRSKKPPFSLEDAIKLYKAMEVYFAVTLAMLYNLTTNVYQTESETFVEEKALIAQRTLNALKDAVDVAEVLNLYEKV
ncbi:unnamed protein product [Bursaphelenchus xylophilus]|uniref:(pine wood nematode) hypothetical protein n=1 Tax=Bursaphelenchus xylophilus TaxID=6326 RepID=A0A1I7S2E1_BURXY|nr:unnamed protein product [Bursaphelenchus xylophilus]CAG9114632.1 unnamed protein product [Bursaphelenchus xylophilus]